MSKKKRNINIKNQIRNCRIYLPRIQSCTQILNRAWCFGNAKHSAATRKMYSAPLLLFGKAAFDMQCWQSFPKINWDLDSACFCFRIFGHAQTTVSNTPARGQGQEAKKKQRTRKDTNGVPEREPKWANKGNVAASGMARKQKLFTGEPTSSAKCKWIKTTNIATLPKHTKMVTLPKQGKMVTLPKQHKMVTLPKQHKMVMLPKKHKMVTLPNRRW